MMYLDENGNEIISIHAAREGGDTFRAAVRERPKNFNPRRP